MITINLIGGLGNQMFQYSFGRSLALIHNKPLFLNTYYLDNDFDGVIKRDFALNKFMINSNIISINNVYSNIILKYKDIINRSLVKERGFEFNNKYLDFIPNNTTYHGYWQSEKYFSNIRDILFNEFTLSEPISECAKELIKNITSTNSISLHIRRGDYTNNEFTYKYHGVCPISYYSNALNYFNDEINSSIIYVFSDDIEWCKQQSLFKEYKKNLIFVENNIPDYEQLFLMSLCHHNIIANSSFSWWGAWLNKNIDKIVIAPCKWFQGAKKNTKDLIPYSWIKL